MYSLIFVYIIAYRESRTSLLWTKIVSFLYVSVHLEKFQGFRYFLEICAMFFVIFRFISFYPPFCLEFAGDCCWRLLLENAAGDCCWRLLLEIAAGDCCWRLLLEIAAGYCCWRLLLEIAAGDYC